MKRRVLTDDQLLLLRKWFLTERLGLAAAWRLVQAQQPPWELKRTALDTYRREILGAASESAAGQVLGAAGDDEERQVGTNRPHLDSAIESDDEEPVEDELDQIGRQLKRVLRLGLTTSDPSVAEKSLRTAMGVAKQLDALRLSRQPDRAPAAVIYLPVESPDPDIYDPNDPGAWPDNPFLRPPYAPDPAVFPPQDPASWPSNPYGCAGRGR